ncbi:MAG: ABC transporter substrate-binding protein [Gammaproteobacteria bacterium]|nr:ABC transporter substrate-binding protein [Gammaproteobacteria bacterium]
MRWLFGLIGTLVLTTSTGSELVTLKATHEPSQSLVIYSSTDTDRMGYLLQAFQHQHPDVRIDYHLMDTQDIYHRASSEMDSQAPTADLLLSSAMDLQIKLVNDGYGASHQSPQTDNLPVWANWRNQAFGFTYEPAVMIYNKALVPELAEVTTRFDLARSLTFDVGYLRKRIVTYDPQHSGLGYLFGTHDAIQSEDFWYLARSLGDMEVILETSSAAMIDKVASGEALIAYNVLGSYARARANENPDLGITIPRDYCLVMSRIAVIPQAAQNPKAAGAFIDFLLSQEGQKLIANAASLYSLRNDIQGEATAARLRQEARGPLIPIHLGPGLLVYLDKLKRQDFLARWRRAMARE